MCRPACGKPKLFATRRVSRICSAERAQRKANTESKNREILNSDCRNKYRETRKYDGNREIRETREKNTDAKNYGMRFNHSKNPKYTVGMQRQIRINCISSCSSSPSCPKNLESSIWEIRGILDRINRMYRTNADSISGIPHLHFILSILSKESPTTFQCAAFKRRTSRQIMFKAVAEGIRLWLFFAANFNSPV